MALTLVHNQPVGVGGGGGGGSRETSLYDGERIWHLSWSPNGSYLASCGEEKLIRIWQCLDIDAWGDFSSSSSSAEGANAMDVDKSPVLAAGRLRCIATLEDEAQTRTIRCCEWSPDGRKIASASFDGTVVVWAARNSGMAHWDQIASLEGHENEVKSVAWSHDGRWLATCGRDKRVWVWEQLEGSNEFECVSMLEGHSQDVKFIIWHPSESILYSASYDDSIKVWAEESDEFYCTHTLTGHGNTVWGLAIDPNSGLRLVSCSADATMMLWEYDGQVWRCVFSVKAVHGIFPIYSLSWNAVHGHLLSGGGDNKVSLSSVVKQDGESKIELLHGSVKESQHEGDVNCVRWNPAIGRSHIAASAGDDGCIKLWRMSL